MATWTEYDGQVWTHDDDKLGFTAWIEADPILISDWETAVAEFDAWRLANPDVSKTEANGAAGVIFRRWMAYANAV